MFQGKLTPAFLSLLLPLTHFKNTSPPNPFTHACTAIIEFVLFFSVIGEEPSPLAIFMFMSLPFKLWMTLAFWWGAFMTTPRHTYSHIHTRWIPLHFSPSGQIFYLSPGSLVSWWLHLYNALEERERVARTLRNVQYLNACASRSHRKSVYLVNT